MSGEADPPPDLAPGTASLLSDLLCFDLYSLSRAMTAVYRPLLEPMGLTYPQFLVLVVLQRRGPGTIREIGDATRLDHGTLTPMLRRLAARDLVGFDRGADARTVVVSLTAAGERLGPRMKDIHCRLGELVGLPDDELGALQHGLRGLADQLDREVDRQSDRELDRELDREPNRDADGRVPPA